MKITQNECVDCGLSCLGSKCPYSCVERYYCDECGNEEKLYEYNGEELCESCITKKVLRDCNVVE